MAVRDEDVAVCANRNPGWPIEQVRPAAADARCTDRHQHLTLGADLENRLTHRHALRVFRGHAEDCFAVVGIRRPNVAVLVHGEPVRMREEADAKAPQ